MEPPWQPVLLSSIRAGATAQADSVCISSAHAHGFSAQENAQVPPVRLLGSSVFWAVCVLTQNQVPMGSPPLPLGV